MAERYDAPTARQHAARLTLLAAGLHCAMATAAGDATPANVLEEVTVTAQRREQALQKTPLAVTVLTGSELATRVAGNSEDLDGVAPLLQVSANGAGSLELSIRGIASTNNSELGDPAVAFNLDGVYMARSRSAAALLFDVQRVEIVRGPQGTLYGRNATAGSINVISNRPTQDGGGSAQLLLGSDDLRRASAQFNLPLSTQFALRAAFQTQSHDGYADNAPRQSDYHDSEAQAGRLQLQWTPGDDTTLLLAADYYHDQGTGSLAGPLGVATTLNGSEAFRFPVSHQGDNDHRNYGLTFTGEWQLPLGQLTYIGSWRRDDAAIVAGSVDDVGGNFSGTGSDALVYCNALTGFGCALLSFFSDQDSHSHELRLAASGARWHAIGGLYLFDESNRSLFHVNPPGLAFDQQRTRSRSRALYGQFSYELTPLTRLTAGLRRTHDEKSRIGATRFATTLVGDLAIGGVVVGLNNADYSWNRTDWKLGVERDLGNQSMLFGSIATGYKAGGFGDGPAGGNNPYDPEELTAYELGWKRRFSDDRLQVNVAAFHYDYRDFQVTAIGEVMGQPSLVTVNAQRARVDGVEAEGLAVLDERNRFDASISFLDARYSTFRVSGDLFHPGLLVNGSMQFCALPGDVAPYCADYSGNRLARAPRWSATLGYEHGWSQTSGAQWLLRVQSRYVSSHNLDYHGFALTEQGAYTRSDLSLRYTMRAARWSALLFVRNVEDVAVLSFAAPRATPPASRSSGSAVYAIPRNFGLQIAASF